MLFKVLFALVFPSFLFSQEYNIGTPIIFNYSPDTYNGGTQNWDLEVSKNGIIYAANNDGLLLFDGENWQSIVQPNKTIGRSLSLSNNGKIYLGGQDEIGYFGIDNYGKLKYHSLLNVIPEDNRDLEDIWQMKHLDSSLVFRNSNTIYKIDGNDCKVVHDYIPSTFLSKVDSFVFYNDLTKGLFKISSGSDPEFVKGSELFIDKNIIEVIKLNDDKYLFLTINHGIYQFYNNTFSPWENNAKDYILRNKLLSGLILKNGNIALGTRLGGLILIDQSGRALYKIDKKSGLQNNSINSLAEDQWGNLWLGSYYGIDKINLSSSLNFFYPDEDLEGAIYDIKLWENRWWFGTTNGLYTLPYKEYYNPFEEKNFELVPNTSGQVWVLDVVDGQLYLGHDNHGALKVSAEGRVQQIGDLPGTWKFVGLSENKMAIGTYDGVYVFKKDNSQWIQHYKVQNLEESSRIIIKDKEGQLWVSHPYRGVYKIKFDEEFENYSVKNYTANSGYETEKGNYVFNLFGTPYLINDSGIFQYDYGIDRFIKDSSLNEYLSSSGRVRKFFNIVDNIWYIAQNETGLINITRDGFDNKISVERYLALSSFYVGGFENMYPINLNNQFLCTNKGVLYHYSDKQNDDHELLTFIASIVLTGNDSVIVSTHYDSRTPLILSPRNNAFEIHFRTNGKTGEELIGYSYKLQGLEENWSEYNLKAFKEYTNLDHGSYQFLLKAKDKHGNVSSVSTTDIIIQTPWYLSNWANVVYALILFSFILALLLIPQKKHKKITEQLVSKQKETEKEMEEIRQEKLKNEIQFKNRELASSTLHLLQKNQTLNSLRNKIEELKKNIKDSNIRKELNNMVSLLRSDLRLEDDWDKFSIHFDQVHNDFIKRLKEKYPQLSTNDYKLCAYLKMNLTTKEIAPLLNISVRGVEISRYRLRKKLGVEKSENLNELMNQI